jgi:UDP-N-acetylmuramoyl-L-alanyl-D-glutamate--2,6-diaminopimelate ligase
MDKILRILKKIIPKKLFTALQPTYHILLSLSAAFYYRFPSRYIIIIGVTGTKGKSSSVELINSILEEAGYKTATAGTIRFKIGETVERNLYKMTMPGRFAIQQFIRKAVDAKCDFVILEMTSEGAKQFRHKFIDLDALLFTNLSPEHIESHGSYEKYLEAKLKIARSLNSSVKRNKWLVVNADDKEHQKFIDASPNAKVIKYSIHEASPYKSNSSGSVFNYRDLEISSPLPGVFNIYNMLGAAHTAKAFDIDPYKIKKGIEKVELIKGRVEKINEGQGFEIVVDYAHTIESLKSLYGAFDGKKKICVLGNTGGGRDKWKRKGMAEIAENECERIFLTNEDPYDEDPLAILNDMEEGIKSKDKLEIIIDRREAIAKALLYANQLENSNESIVLITGKGTDPYIMIEDGKKIPWSDEQVAREEIKKILNKNA